MSILRSAFFLLVLLAASLPAAADGRVTGSDFIEIRAVIHRQLA